ncbi:auxin-responsive protein IAA29-like isoform X1 [Corylus avellana]|uniref:auxin-responsive protein IAA29-like isoform X1 n=1 Tax=Corylus avellana TaxID=13451 RepID=UPI00286C5586|nr:auxin-responsive protein IAA29-like isoform X1 [Corylus avellana]
MELQLGLALPTNPTKGFDLNYYGYEPKEVVVSGLWFDGNNCYVSSHQDINIDDNKKRSFSQAFENSSTDRAVPRTLPLLLWNNRPNEEDDPKDPNNHHSLFAFNKNDDGDRDGVVGWPPIKSWRNNNNKRVCHDNQGGRRLLENAYAYCGGRRSNSMYVKVKMEGVAIGRKIDLTLHNSFQTLTDTLIDMFQKWLLETGQKNSNIYKLAYQDKEGDWLYTEDVSWRTFIGSVQRLKLLKSSSK